MVIQQGDVLIKKIGKIKGKKLKHKQIDDLLEKYEKLTQEINKRKEDAQREADERNKL